MVDISPITGPREGGTEITIVDSVVDMSACSDDFADGVIGALWSDISSGTGAVVEIGTARRVDADTGATAASVAGLRTVETPENVDVQATFVTTDAEIPFGTSEVTMAELSLVVSDTPGDETDFSVRIISNPSFRSLAIRARQNGMVSIDQQQAIATFVRGRTITAVLRLLRSGNKITVFRNNSKVLVTTWIDTAASAQLSIANDVTDSSRVLTSFRDYIRRPVIEFGTEPMTVSTFLQGNRIAGQTPAFPKCADPSVVDVTVTGCNAASAVESDGFTFTLNQQLIKFQQGQREFTVCNDPVLRRRR